MPTWLASIQSLWQAFTPTNWFVFEGNSFALFASGNGEPWPFDGPEVGFAEVMEECYEEDIPELQSLDEMNRERYPDMA